MMQKVNLPEKNASKFLKVAQIPAICTGVRIIPKHRTKHLSCNLDNTSLEKHIYPVLVECVQSKVLSWQ
jgi:hypothetical protein